MSNIVWAGLVVSVLLVSVFVTTVYFSGGVPATAQSVVSEVDSRVVDVERACMADEVTVKHRNPRTGEPTVEEHDSNEQRCRQKLVKKIYQLANEQCQLYSKIQDEEEQCKAHRGNLNATDDISYSHGRCILGKDVKYVCN